MKVILYPLMLITWLGLGSTLLAQGNPVSMCDAVSISVSSSDSTYVQLYHAGFFLFGATENVGGFSNVCYWTATTMDGETLHEAETAGEWETQSFMYFEHNLAVTDSIIVDLVITSPLEEFDCCMTDTLIWEEAVSGTYGNWSVEDFNAGVHCDSSTGIETHIENASLSIYPQPAQHYFQLTNLPMNAMLIVFDLSGKQVLSMNAGNPSATYDISSLQKGIYFVQVFDEQKAKLATLRLLKAM